MRVEDLKKLEEKYPYGTIVYFVGDISKNLNEKTVYWGLVKDYDFHNILLEGYDFKDIRYIDNTPYKNFETPTKPKKLPKGWTYNTELFKIEYHYDGYCGTLEYRLDDKDTIYTAIQNHNLVKIADIDYSHPRAVIENGTYYITKVYEIEYVDGFNVHTGERLIPYDNIYKTYEEAKEAIDKYVAELERVANLSDEEYALEELDKCIDRALGFKYIDEVVATKFKEYINSLDNIGELEFRMLHHTVEYKKWNNKKWINIMEMI